MYIFHMNCSLRRFPVCLCFFRFKNVEKRIFQKGLSRKIWIEKSVGVKKVKGFKLGEKSYRRRSILKERGFFLKKKCVSEGFQSLGLIPSVVDAIHKDVLSSLRTVYPTPIQFLAIPKILRSFFLKQSSKTFLLAAETGSGKTLAYVAPILHILKMEEKMSSNVDSIRLVNSPRCIILVPTAELVRQVYLLLKQMSHNVKFRPVFTISSLSLSFIKKNILTTVSDVLVATPFQIYRFIQEKKLIMNEVRYIVADEADTLLDTSFSSLVLFILNAATKLKLLIFCSSVVSRKFDRLLSKYFPDFSRIVTPSLHTISKKISFNIVDAQKDFKNNKKLACVNILEKIIKDETNISKKVIIFFNERKQSDEFAEYLKNKGFSAFSLTKYTKDRLDTIHNFIYGSFSEKSCLSILVTTDLNSRGVDTIGLKNVILFDIPYNPTDLIHRLGRIGRGGKKGKAYLILGKEKNREWVDEIKKSIKIGKALI
ncbi:hypothetical protein PORY_000809 [Pneumocystis oryctolagi]|uniref:Uncharacterized protein n=1 Tax=Pneumocystis oryctolagi TaxID=42067 RepID=A0ACB7CIX8_9ASCO|nr:hypothetical protein PORY_000809 [Pneumocystis oryctolagi]